MTDIHCHVLPEMDDGSRSVEESVAMLEALSAQGVGCVAATPHFYAMENSSCGGARLRSGGCGNAGNRDFPR